MKALVIYDSQFGNTELVARAIGQALVAEVKTDVLRASEVTPAHLSGVGLLVVGSPTQSFHATKPVDEVLKGLSLQGIPAAAFDTRFDMSEVESRALRLAVRIAGDNAYAATRIAAQLGRAGAVVLIEPEGFIVTDTEGPLRPGELARAGKWGEAVLALARSAAG